MQALCKVSCQAMKERIGTDYRVPLNDCMKVGLHNGEWLAEEEDESIPGGCDLAFFAFCDRVRHKGHTFWRVIAPAPSITQLLP